LSFSCHQPNSLQLNLTSLTYSIWPLLQTQLWSWPIFAA
jgi:hypothetical protein